MSATAATADSVSLNGYIEGWFTSGDNTTGIANSVYSQSVYVSYSTTLDNGMGFSTGFTLTNGAHAAGFSVDTGMGTIQTGSYWQVNSAADGMDSLPNNANVQSSNKKLGTYDDGDNQTGEGIKYTSPSMNGWTLAASIGENVARAETSSGTQTRTANQDRTTSVAVSGSVMGLGIATGVVNQGDGEDDSFLTLGYSVAGVGIGYGYYDSEDDETTVVSVTTDIAGMTVGYRYDDLDATTDNSMNTYSVQKSLGAMSLTLMFEEQDTADNEEWNLVYALGF
jgi:hypothetical protein